MHNNNKKRGKYDEEKIITWLERETKIQLYEWYTILTLTQF